MVHWKQETNIMCVVGKWLNMKKPDKYNYTSHTHTHTHTIRLAQWCRTTPHLSHPWGCALGQPAWQGRSHHLYVKGSHASLQEGQREYHNTVTTIMVATVGKGQQALLLTVRLSICRVHSE